MQRVTNCLVIQDQQVLLLKKPRRGWYAIPGGKMEQGETIKESVTREYLEETALTLKEPDLLGVFTFNIYEQEQFIQEWMMFTFVCYHVSGEAAKFCQEGELEWIPFHQVEQLPMAEGDRIIFRHVRHSNDLLYAAFQYTSDYELLGMRFDSIASGTFYKGDTQ